MVTNELLIRTIYAAKEARKCGYECTAEALDQIIEDLLSLNNQCSQFEIEKCTHPQQGFTHFN